MFVWFSVSELKTIMRNFVLNLNGRNSPAIIREVHISIAFTISQEDGIQNINAILILKLFQNLARSNNRRNNRRRLQAEMRSIMIVEEVLFKNGLQMN